MENNEIQKFLPLSESTYYILLSLVESRHGYAIMQHVEEISRGKVTVGPGTLYGAFNNLERAGIIRGAKEVERRKYYVLTDLGRQILAEQVRRLQIMAENGQQVLPYLEN